MQSKQWNQSGQKYPSMKSYVSSVHGYNVSDIYSIIVNIGHTMLELNRSKILENISAFVKSVKTLKPKWLYVPRDCKFPAV